MKVYRPRHIRLEGEQKITETPSIPVDKTAKTSVGGVLAVLSTPLQGALQNFEGQPEPPADPESAPNPQTPADRTDKTPRPHPPRQVEVPARDPDPSGCPTHWHHVPELPPKGSTVRMVDRGGYGCLYRVKAVGRWWLLRFLPPLDGTLSLTDSGGRVRVLASLEEAGLFLGALEARREDAA